MLHLEDFVTGDTLSHGAYVVSREEIVAFADAFDPQPVQLDPAAAEAFRPGGLAASDWHTSAIGMRLVFDGLLVRTASLGAPGIDEVRWQEPVRPGDRLTLDGRVTAVRESQSKPDRGIVSFAFALSNQNGVGVMTQANSIMVRRRPSAGES